MADPTPQPAEGTLERLRELSERATPGPWFAECEPGEGTYGCGEDTRSGFGTFTVFSGSEKWLGKPRSLMGTENSSVAEVREEHHVTGSFAWDEVGKRDTAFVVALENAYRSGLLSCDPAPPAASEPVLSVTDVETAEWQESIAARIAIDFIIDEGDLSRLLCDRTALLATLRDRDATIAGLEDGKDEAYHERNQVVAALARLFPSGTAKTDIPGWLPEWHGCVYIDLPSGQVSWHYHDREAPLFAGLPPYAGQWDGHDTPEKYRRLAALAAATARPERATVSREALARAICGVKNNPDEDWADWKPNVTVIPARPAWLSYLGEADAVLALLAQQPEAQDRKSFLIPEGANGWRVWNDDPPIDVAFIEVGLTTVGYIWRETAPEAQGGAVEPDAWLYEHDGMVHDAEHPAPVSFTRWVTCEEPWNETPLYRAPPAKQDGRSA